MKKRFTLIEIIAVIAVLGILAIIIIPNVSKKKESAMVTQVTSNIRNLQTAVDMYYVDTGIYPSDIQPTLEIPQKINMEFLYPKYLRNLPKNIMNEFYWVDFIGKVWSSTVDAPTEMMVTSEGIEWNTYSEVSSYTIYHIEDENLLGQANKKPITLRKQVLNHSEINRFQYITDKKTLISSIDKYGLETAPIGFGYQGIENEYFNPILSKEGVFEYTLSSESKMYWISFNSKEKKPEGTDVIYDFSIENEDGTMTEYSSDFHALNPSKKIIARITMIGKNGKLPSVLDFQIFYHFEKDTEVFSRPKVTNKTPEYSEYKYELKQNEGIGYIKNYDPTSDKIYYEKDGTLIEVGFISEIPKGSNIIIHRDNNNIGIPVIKIEKEKSILVHNVDKDFIPPKETDKPIEKPTEKDPELNNPDWETVQEIVFVTGSTDGQIAKWLNIEITDNQPENTKIVYRYATLHNGIWSSYIDNFTSLRNSKAVKVYASLQVKKELVDKIENPEVISILIHTDKGPIDLTPYKPNAVIKLNKNNNQNNEIITNTSQITWDYEVHDPFGYDIVEVEWGGDKRDSYPVGTYEVTLRVKNSKGAWSNISKLKFDVKDDKPIAIISPDNQTTFSNRSPIKWDYSKSIDPDGDTIVKAEWSGDYSKEKYNAGDYIVKLRVQDEEGNWSDWVEKSFSVIDSIFYNIGGEALDNNDTTFVSLPANTIQNIFWEGDLTNRIVRVKISVNTGTRNYVTIYDKNNNPLNAINITSLQNVDTSEHLSNGNTDISFLMPENAHKISITSNGASAFRIHTIMDYPDLEIAEQVENVVSTPSDYSIRFDWIKNPNTSKVVIYRDGVLSGSTTENYYIDKTLYSDQSYLYEIRTVDNKGSFSEPFYITGKTTQPEVVWRGLDPEAFDRDDKTIMDTNSLSQQLYNVTWNKDMSNKMIKIIFNTNSGKQTLHFEDEYGNKLDHINYTSKEINDVTLLTSSSGTRTKTMHLVVPNNAKKMLIDLKSSNIKIHSVEEVAFNEIINPITNLKSNIETNAVSFSWDTNETVKSVMVYRNKKFISEVTGNSFTDNSIFDNFDYTYEFISLSQNKNATNSISLKVKTLKRDVSFRGHSEYFFDNDLNTSENPFIGSSLSTEITWDKNIGGYPMKITFDKASNNTSVIKFFNNTEQLTFFNLDTNKYETEFGVSGNVVNVIVPHGATKLEISRKTTVTSFKVSDISIQYKEEEIKKISNLQVIKNKRKLNLEWDSLVNVSKYAIFLNNEFETYVEGNSYEFNPLYDDTLYSFEIIPISNNSRWGINETYQERTLKDDISWRGLSPEAFDGNMNTLFNHKGSTSNYIEWNNIDNRKRLITINSEFISNLIITAYKDNVRVDIYNMEENAYVSTINKTYIYSTPHTFRFIVPEGVNKIELKGKTNTTYSIYEVTSSDVSE